MQDTGVHILYRILNFPSIYNMEEAEDCMLTADTQLLTAYRGSRVILTDES